MQFKKKELLDQLNELVVLHPTKLDNALSEYDETALPKLPAPNMSQLPQLNHCLIVLLLQLTWILIQTIHQLLCNLRMKQQPPKNLRLQQHVGCAGFTHGANGPLKVKVPRVQQWITLWMFTKLLNMLGL